MPPSKCCWYLHPPRRPHRGRERCRKTRPLPSVFGPRDGVGLAALHVVALERLLAGLLGVGCQQHVDLLVEVPEEVDLITNGPLAAEHLGGRVVLVENLDDDGLVARAMLRNAAPMMRTYSGQSGIFSSAFCLHPSAPLRCGIVVRVRGGMNAIRAPPSRSHLSSAPRSMSGLPVVYSTRASYFLSSRTS